MGRRKGDKTIIPPIHAQFKKGVVHDGAKISKGKKESFERKKDILSHIRELEKIDISELEIRLKSIQSGEKKGITAGEYVALKHWTGLMKGDPKALESYLNRKYGTPKQSVELSGETTTNMNVNVIQQIQQTLENSKNDGEMDREGELADD